MRVAFAIDYMVFNVTKEEIRLRMAAVDQAIWSLPPALERRLADDPGEWQHLRMKRTNLVLDEQLLDEATRLSGEKTYSAAVMRALEEFVRRVKARQILELRGSGLWEGELGAMRRDRARKKKRAS